MSSTFPSVGNDGRAISSDWDPSRAVREGLKGNSWVYAAATKIATGLGSVPLLLERRKGENWTPDPAHPLQALLKRPNPFMGRQDMQERWGLDMLLSGNAVWWLNIAGKVPVEMWPLRPGEIKPIQSRADFISGYEWQIDSLTKRRLKIEEVGHWMFVDPDNPRWGLAPLKAAAGAVDLDAAASRWNRAVLANDGKPSLGILLGESLNVDQMRQASAFIREQITGGSARQALVLGGTSKIQPLSLSATDLDYLNGRRFSREEIGAVFGVPPILMAFGEAATFANLDAAKSILWEDRIVPLLDDLCQGLMGRLFPYWELTEDEWRIRADLSGIRALQSNLKTEAETFKLRAEAFAVMVGAGVPANMAATASGVPLVDVPGGDEPRSQGPPMPVQAKARAAPYQRKDKTEDARLQRLDNWSEEIKKKVSALLTEQGDSLASAYVNGTLDKATDLSLDDWQTLLEATHTAVLESEGALAYKQVLKAITSSGGGVFDVLDPNVTEFIKSRAGDMAKNITDTTRQALKTELAAGIDAGESSREIAKRIKTLHAGWSDARAELISRTEVSTAFGASHQLSAEQAAADAGVEMVKLWRSAHDNRVRDEHAAMDGEEVGLDEDFSNGLPYPSEPNCRCVVLYVEKGK
ncbi:hypothetical protein DKM44_12885 [Deinococcus irradiatisoli]|uniref:Phage head morphogenesis domain-containing protein n=1 Tax=Deinococcus irradiatisoli TaxID=2202254 RepID=A0A2Z3JFQ1_9DEIO|nr:phage portal protein [Deinococcus irradiatisoli]AWN24017.1 hypothetical protein DKM44_12885 [Deinococcus irradiatisoli]